MATRNVIYEVGTTPVFADFDPLTRNIDALALIPAQRYAELAAQGLPMKVVARDARRVVEKP